MTFRNPQNVVHATDGEVLVSWADDPKIGFDGTFSDDWETIGILNDGSRVEFNRVVERNKVNGWGFGVVDTSAKPGDLTASAETLEDNETVQKIAFPHTATDEGVTIDGDAKILYHDNEVARVFVAMVETMSNGKTRIRASRYRAVASMEDMGFGQEASGRSVSFDFETGTNKDAFDEIVIGSAEKAAANDQIIRFAEAVDSAGSSAFPEPAEDPEA